MRGTHAVLPEHGFTTSALMPPEQAVIAFLSRAALVAPSVQNVGIADSFGRILARNIAADAHYPAIARSTMDGFAVRSGDLPGALRLAGDVLMGRVFERALRAGETVRIPTGGALPEGADAVVPIEDAVLEGDRLTVCGAVAPLDCITPPGEDMRAGESVLRAGRRIGGAQASVLATLGIAQVPVFRRPRIGVISSGDELVGVGDLRGPAQIRDSNRYAVGAALYRHGCDAVALPAVSDRPGALEAALKDALGACEAVIITGGSSVGLADRTPAAIDATGSPGVIVHGLRVKPGKPTVLASIAGKAVIGLPGNPTSALMILEAVAAPIIAALTGRAGRAFTIEAVLERDAPSRAGWTWFVPVTLRDDGARYLARPLAIRSSSTSLLARAHGFLTIDEEK
nr:molybdopterin molybdotransferase MoeA [Candidatus Eremiobacteraeota bacterium]